jgi:dipeptidyl aminopeptidase/acylaminoacyl peptidase
MKTNYIGLVLGVLSVATTIANADEARLVRYPHYHNGKVAFTYLGDIWTADESGLNIQRLTAHHARDMTPRFSPDGKWIAFSSDREGNLDVWVIPVSGGASKQLTYHSSDDSVLGWTPDSQSVLFASSRGDDFLGTLYTVPVAIASTSTLKAVSGGTGFVDSAVQSFAYVINSAPPPAPAIVIFAVNISGANYKTTVQWNDVPGESTTWQVWVTNARTVANGLYISPTGAYSIVQNFKARPGSQVCFSACNQSACNVRCTT